MTDAAPRLTNRQLLQYAIAEYPLSMAAIPMAIFVPAFYTRDLGLSLSATGTILMVARISDVLTDPLVGQLSDRTRTRFGRRKPWILAGVPLLLLSLWMLFVPVAGAVSNAYFATWVILLWLGWTFVAIPLYAWGAELSSDYHERTRIATWRTFAGVAGTLTTIVAPLAAWQLFDYGAAIGESLHITALGAVVSMVIAMALLMRVPESKPIETRRIPLTEGLRVMWRNGPFKRLMLGFTIGGIGPSLAAPLYVLYVNHVIQHDLAGNVILLVFYMANLLGVAMWGALARRVGKRRAWVTGMSMMIVSQPWYLTLGPGDLLPMIGILFVGGLGAGSFAALPAAMKADVIDLDRLKSGEDRTGLFFSVWSAATKLIAAFSVGFAFQVLSLFAFEPNGVNGEAQLWALKIVFAGIPVLCYAGAIAVVWNYPISEARHARMVARLTRRAARAVAMRGGAVVPVAS